MSPDPTAALSAYLADKLGLTPDLEPLAFYICPRCRTALEVGDPCPCTDPAMNHWPTIDPEDDAP